MKGFYFFIGTSAEFIKLAPVIKEFKRRNTKFKIITSGQNAINFDEFKSFTGKLVPNIELPKKISKSSLFGFFIWTMKTFFLSLRLFIKELKKTKREDFYLIIHGDTISSLIGALVGKMVRVKIVQIESGLRSFNIFEPIPEEMCRLVISRIGSIFFAPNAWALNNLKKYKGEKISTGENTLIESCSWAIGKNNNSDYIKSLKNYYILFIHRQEHIYFNKDQTWNMIQTIMNNAPKKLNCVLVMHALTSKILSPTKLDELSQTNKNLIILPKLPYVDFVNLIHNSEFIATDSCTSQEEAYYLGVPYLGLRNLTERVEGLNKNVVISKGNNKTMEKFLGSYKKYKKIRIKTNRKPSKIVVDYLINRY
ncbi:MAG TPA: UDP-N-acetylglucosamine 2-epimerase [Patescibacteria group bacterium]|nr:UDP-N-acetylglucosamine 2-epimerase [Patescibacteria group bacterium]